MSEKPILFSGPMIRALLDGRKTQTRRIVKPQPERGESGTHWSWSSPGFPARLNSGSVIWPDSLGSPVSMSKYCPYGAPGDRLWVRETCLLTNEGSPFFECLHREPNGERRVKAFRADEESKALEYWESWTPSIHMPRWASRLTLEIVNVRVERVQDISEADAKAEGFSASDIVTVKGALGPFACEMTGDAGSARRSFFNTFFALNTGRVPADANPWVWVIEFTVAPPPPGAQP